MKLKIFFTIFSMVVLGAAFIACDEGMNMAGDVLNGQNPTETVDPVNPVTNGEVKKPEPKKPEPKKPDPEEPKPDPTLAIDSVVQEDDGSVTVSGTSTELPKGTTVTVTLSDLVTAETATDKKGRWSVTIPAAEAKQLAVGTVTVTAVAAAVTANSSLVIPEPELTIVPVPETIETITRWDPEDITGLVHVPGFDGDVSSGVTPGHTSQEKARQLVARLTVFPVPGVTLTVIAGAKNR